MPFFDYLLGIATHVAMVHALIGFLIPLIMVGMLTRFFDCVEDWSEHEKQVVIIAVGECGYRFEADTSPDEFDIDIYHVDNLRELAEQFIDEGLFGEVPESLRFYIDHDAIARDLAADYASIEIGGERLVYRCG